MAGDWIKMRTDLATDPAVIAIADATGLDEDTVVGKLHRLWSWADQQTEDGVARGNAKGNAKGNAAGVTEKWIDRYLGAQGFAKAMATAGWLEIYDDGIVFPDFLKHNGQTGKRRALTAKRVAKSKAKKGNAVGNAEVTQEALPREEKRREYKTPVAPLDFSRIAIPPKLDFPEVRELLMRWHEARVKKHGPDLDPEMAITIALPMFPSAQHLEYNLRRAASGAWKTLACREEPPAHDTQSEHRATFRRRNPGPPATTGS